MQFDKEAHSNQALMYRWDGSMWQLEAQKIYFDTTNQMVHTTITKPGTYALFEQANSPIAMSTFQRLVGNDTPNSFNFNIYPNPAKESINIASTFIKGEAMNITLMDISGKIIWELETKELDIIKLPKLSAGLYLISLRAIKTNSSKTKTIVIN